MKERITAGQTLDAKCIAAILDQWRPVLDRAISGVKFSPGQLTVIDTAGVQLLVACKKELLARGQDLAVAAYNEALRRHAATLGLAEFLGL